MTSNNTPLSGDEFTTLDTLLSSADDECLGIDEAHGYITALIVCHHPADQPEWLEAILGDSLPNNALNELLTRMYNDINTTLNSGLRFEPMIIEEEMDGELFEIHEGWCFGFMLAVTQHHKQWDQLPTSKEELLAPIAQLALFCSDDEMDMDDDEYNDCVELLPGSVTTLYNHWKNSTAE